MNNVLDMTVEEFSEHIKMLNERVLNFKDQFTVTDKRQDPKRTRSYANAQRGNFQGKAQKNAREMLKQLNISVDRYGYPIKGKYDG
tara:strand:+ start:2124 stop:2381 length:258 start_codon:yes stop_codon:yes gene_type:complete